MKRVSGYIEVKTLGSYHYEFYVDDDATDEEIAQKVVEHEQMSHKYKAETDHKAKLVR